MHITPGQPFLHDLRHIQKTDETTIYQLYHHKESTMWLPDRLYELLPYLYAVAGFLTATFIDTPVGFASGFILLFTACIVWMMRRDYRQGRVNKKNR
jgi:hypothetical protein